MIRKNPMHDVDNPPGQARYLRDVIRKYQDEDQHYKTAQETSKAPDAPQALTDAETRLERLKTALLSLCDEQEDVKVPWLDIRKDILKILEENS